MNNNDIEKTLEQDARLDTERMPEDMAKVNAKQKAESLRSFMDRHKLNQADVARKLGVSSSMVNQFLKGTYSGDNVGMAKAVVGLINAVDRRKRRVRLKPFVETAVAKMIYTLIKHTSTQVNDDEGVISLVIGDSGHGKSLCLREYARCNSDAIYIELHNAMSAVRVFKALAAEVGSDESGSIDNVSQCLIRALRNREVVVIIDEASSLTVKQLSQLRTVIVDQCRCPLILSGNMDLLHTINQSKAKHGYQALDQFRSRMARVLDLDTLAASKGGGGLHNGADIRRLYELGGLTLTGDGAKLLRAIAAAPQSGRIRTCSKVMSVILMSHARGRIGSSVSADRIKDAIVQLGLPVMQYLPMIVPSESEDQSQTEQQKAAG